MGDPLGMVKDGETCKTSVEGTALSPIAVPPSVVQVVIIRDREGTRKNSDFDGGGGSRRGEGQQMEDGGEGSHLQTRQLGGLRHFRARACVFSGPIGFCRAGG